MGIKVWDVLGRIMNGLGFAAIINFVALSILLINDMNPPIEELWRRLLGSMLMGAYYGSASFWFQCASWSPLKQVVIHFSASLLVFLPIAFWAEWLPLEWKSVFIGIAIFIVIYGIFWCCYAYYYWRLTKEMNNSIHKK